MPLTGPGVKGRASAADQRLIASGAWYDLGATPHPASLKGGLEENLSSP